MANTLEKKLDFTSTAELLRYLGIPRTYNGFDQLAMAVELAVEDENRLLHVTREVYQVVARRYGISVQSVLKNIRTVINVCWRGGGRDRLVELTRYCEQSAPATDEFIDLLTDYIKRNRG
ncbi:MAG: sporulation initiation factor Spo0A C-terminal domain-containing protein [Oscillospiraceae bacterium]|nr:sporulation initiation factor Spo0A C-terminal domain-containing protein [Oscillospiraceae bacterium]